MTALICGLMVGMGELFSLDNPIQNYAWGSYETLAKMRGVPAPTVEPEAELWVGAHSSAPSQALVNGQFQPLDQLVEQNPGRFLNPDRDHQSFPFLFKVLAIEAPLSIQVHPTDEQAQAGFEDENARGVALNDPARNYKDRFSKPETVIALTPMRILTGVRDFKELKAIAQLFQLTWLQDALTLAKTPKQLLTSIIRLPQETALAALEETLAAARTWRAKEGEVPGQESLAAGLVELILLIDSKYPGDWGLLVALVMNLVYLAPGESAYTPDGQVHAYVSGTAIELMNPSDNVMRAGLTSKHIDREELIKILGENQDHPQIQTPAPLSSVAGRYQMWDERLSVTHLTLETEQEVVHPVKGLVTALCTEGQLTIEDAQSSFTLTGTQAVLYVGREASLRIRGKGQLYLAAQE